jgi:DNA-3-methyladenine glycosylase
MPLSSSTALHDRIGRDFFNRPTLTVAPGLLGKFIVRHHEDRQCAAMITEIEAYKGPRDAAAHTHGGRRTSRVEPLYAEGGTAYVYLIYGMHWMLNFSTVGAEIPEGVLIRGVLPENSGKAILGPGRVCKHLAIDKSLSGIDAITAEQLWLEDRGVVIPKSRIVRGPRVGIDYAGPYWAARPWRFSIDTSSGPIAHLARPRN